MTVGAAARHGRNLAALLAGEAVQKIIALLLFMALSRWLTIEENGRYGLFTAVFPLMVVFLNMGFYDVAVRDIAQHPARAGALVGGAWRAQGLLFVGVFALCLGAVFTGAGGGEKWLMPAALAVAALFAAGRMNLAVMAARERFDAVSLWTVALRAGAAAAAAALAFSNAPVWLIVAGLAPVHLCWWLAGAAWNTRRSGVVPARPEPGGIARLFREGVPMAAGGFAATLYFAMDLPLYRFFADETAAGQYAIGVRFMMLLFPLADAAGAVMYPLLSRRSLDPGGGESAPLARCHLAMLCLVAPMAAGAALTARPLTLFIAGEKYLPGAFALAGLTASFALFLPALAAITHLRARGRQRTVMVVVAGACLAKTALVSALAGPWQDRGMVLANLLAGLLMAGMLLFFSLRLAAPGTAGWVGRNALRGLAAAAAMAVVLWPLRDWPAPATVPLGAVVFLAAGWLAGLRSLLRGDAEEAS